MSCERVVVGPVHAPRNLWPVPGAAKVEYCCTALIKYQHSSFVWLGGNEILSPTNVMVRSSPSQACSNSFALCALADELQNSNATQTVPTIARMVGILGASGEIQCGHYRRVRWSVQPGLCPYVRISESCCAGCGSICRVCWQ